MHSWAPPSSFDGYRILRRIGRGGMGEVHLAVDSLLDRRVAIKFISAPEPDPNARERFLVEARAIARLQHPNVVSIYRVGTVQGVPYLVSEYVEGQSLNTLVKPVPWRKVLSIGTGISRALAAAHQRGVLHRDIKPANAIITTDGETKLLDFGIAKLLDATTSPRGPLDPLFPASIPCSLPPVELSTMSLRVPAPVRISFGPDDQPTGSIPCQVAVIQLVEPTAPLTQIGHVIGTPAYMAPEVRRGEAATFRSDVYSLGVLLYELCANRLPHVKRTQNQDDSLRPVPLLESAPGVDEAFAAVVDRCLHPDPAMRYSSGNEVRRALAQLTPEARLEVMPEGNPYPGLRAFDEDRAALYFGRDSEIRAVLERLTTAGLVVVAADSGVGKSSLCKAGVLPRVQRWFGSDRVWSTASVIPGRSPSHALAGALAPILHEDPTRVERIILEDPGELGRLVRAKLAESEGLVLFLDQAEELVTLCEPTDAAACAIAMHWLAAAHSSVRVLVAARSDFLGHLTSLPGLGDAIGPALYFLRPLSRERIREAIVAPARSKGVTFATEAMVEDLVQSAAEAEGGLPLLQFALSELWEAKPPQAATISEQTFQDVGGARGALARHADHVLASLSHVQRSAAERVLRDLVTGQNTRARRSCEELGATAPATASALRALVAGRLVVACDSNRGTTYEIAHEALIRSWSTLVHLLAANAEARMVHERLRTAAAEWERLSRSRSSLWNRKQLQETFVLKGIALTESEEAFLRASRRQRRVRLGLGAFAAVAVLGAVTGVHGATVHAEEARRRALVDEAAAHAVETLSRAEEAARQARRVEETAFAAFDRGAGEAEAMWSQALAARTAVAPLLDLAERQAEAALLLDGSRQDVRDSVAAVLLARAIQADARFDAPERDRVRARAALYDASGERTREWSRTRTVSIVSDPVGAVQTLERDDGGTWVANPGSDGEGVLSLAPGSYRATLRLEGYVDTLLPFEVRRDQDVLLRVPMIPSNQVPDGFVYVPPGVGWFGSGAEDSLRSGFFHAVPIHPVQSSGFFIARHETTHWQWLEYLRSLTGEARRARLPTVGAGGFLGSLGVIERADGSFELSLHAGKQRHRAAEGELLRLARPLRQEVDWLAMPVTGISALDAAAYAAWLRESGKVPGARLCTEVEWERAARGADRRAYPHGDSLAPNQANVDTTYDKIPEAMAPDEVGSYPASRSPFGVEDMAGNAWEWTTHANEPSRFVARGGSFYYTAQVARIENREMPEASFRDVSVGLRVCADVESRGSSRISAPNQRALLPTVVQVAEEAAEFEEKPR